MNPATLARIRELHAGGKSSAQIAALLEAGGIDCSQSTVKRAIRKDRRAALVRAETRERTRAELLAAEEAAEDDAALAAATLEVLCFDEPEVRASLDAGDSVVTAILASSHARALLVLRAPESIAELVEAVVDDPLVAVRDERQSARDFERERRDMGKAQHARAIALLESALEIVRKNGIADRYRRTKTTTEETER